jgi:hypothetical protein
VRKRGAPKSSDIFGAKFLERGSVLPPMTLWNLFRGLRRGGVGDSVWIHFLWQRSHHWLESRCGQGWE